MIIVYFNAIYTFYIIIGISKFNNVLFLFRKRQNIMLFQPCCQPSLNLIICHLFYSKFPII